MCTWLACIFHKIHLHCAAISHANFARLSKHSLQLEYQLFEVESAPPYISGATSTVTVDILKTLAACSAAYSRSACAACLVGRGPGLCGWCARRSSADTCHEGHSQLCLCHHCAWLGHKSSVLSCLGNWLHATEPDSTSNSIHALGEGFFIHLKHSRQAAWSAKCIQQQPTASNPFSDYHFGHVGSRHLFIGLPCIFT